eukprot:UC1_evm1s587
MASLPCFGGRLKRAALVDGGNGGLSVTSSMLSLMVKCCVISAALVVVAPPFPYAVAETEEAHLSHSQLLLPVLGADSPAASWTLSARGGCYTWSTRRPDIISVAPLVTSASKSSLYSSSSSSSATISSRTSASSSTSGTDSVCPRGTSTRASVTVQRPGGAVVSPRERAAAVVVARHAVTQAELRCDVFVSEVARAEVVTTSRTVFLDDAPQVIRVAAFDEEGNKFTTHGGLSFKWELARVNKEGEAAAEQAETAAASSSGATAGEDDTSTASTAVAEPADVLQVLPLTGSNYDAPDPSVYALEAAGLRGYSVLARALRTGRVLLRATLTEGHYADANVSCQAAFTVVKKLAIEPALSYLIPQQRIAARVVQDGGVRSGTSISLPSAQYYLRVDDDSLLGLDADGAGGLVAGRHPGATNLRLYDRRSYYDAHTQPLARVNVVTPATLVLGITPYDPTMPSSAYVLEAGREYKFALGLRDHAGHDVDASADFRFSLEPGPALEILESTNNGSWYLVRAARSVHGTTRVAGAFTGHAHGKNDGLNLPVKGTWDIMVNEPVQVSPSSLLLPLPAGQEEDDATGVAAKLAARAVGGSGAYVWATGSAGVATVDADGVLTSVGAGDTVVRACDRANLLHCGEVPLAVRKPSSLRFGAGSRAVPVGASLVLTLAVVDGQDRAFDTCQDLGVTFGLGTDGVFEQQKTEAAAAAAARTNAGTAALTAAADAASATGDPRSFCLSITLTAKAPGDVVVTASFGAFVTTVTVSAFEPLAPLVPTTVVSFGAALDVWWHGGPRRAAGMQTSLHRMQPDAVEASPLTSYGQRHGFRVTCRALGCQDLTLRLEPRVLGSAAAAAAAAAAGAGAGAAAAPTDVQALESHARFCCSHPHVAELRFIQKNGAGHIGGSALASDDRCQGLAAAPILAGDAAQAVLRLWDAEGNLFSNASTLDVLWKATGGRARFASGTTTTTTSGKANDGGGDNYRGEPTRVLELVGAPGDIVNVNASVSGYASGLNGVPSEGLPAPAVSAAQRLELAVQASLHPPSVLLFSHPENRVTLDVQDGSGVFDLSSSTFSPARVALVGQGGRTIGINVTGNVTGDLSLAINDACLVGVEPRRAEITVANVANVRVVARDLVQVGSTIGVTVCVADASGTFFLRDQHDLMDMRVETTGNFVRIEPVPESETTPSPGVGADACGGSGGSGARFRVTGLRPGQSTLSVSVLLRHGKSEGDAAPRISASPHAIQVFNPLSLEPRAMLLLPRSCAQVAVAGGPREGRVDLAFTVDNATVATVNDVGLICGLGLVGETVVHVRAFAAQAGGGAPLLLSEDHVKVSVHLLTGVRIASGSTKYLSGARTTVHVEGLAGETPFTYAEAPMHVRWQVSNEDVISVASPYFAARVPLEDGDFSAVLNTVNPGTASLTAHVEFTEAGVFAAPGAVLSSTHNVQVVEPLRILSGARLLLQLGSSFQLRTNYDASPDLLTITPYSLSNGQQAGGVGAKNSGGGGGGGVVSVSPTGLLVASNVAGTEVVRVTVAHKGFNQTDAVLVEVDSVADVGVFPLSMHWPPGRGIGGGSPVLPTLPVGVTAEFRVSLYDRSGRVFDTVVWSSVRHTLHRFDRVRVRPGIENSSLLVTAAQPGTTVLRITAGQQAHDFIQLNVVPAIAPADALVHIGSRVCFSSFFQGKLPAASAAFAGGDGVWGTSNDRLAAVQDSALGYVLAREEGRVAVTFNRSVITTTHLDIAHVAACRADVAAVEAGPPLSNAYVPGRAPVRIPLHFMGPGGAVFTPLKACASAATNDGGMLEQQVRFSCRLEPAVAASAFTVEAVYDATSGASACVISSTLADSPPPGADIFGVNELVLVVAAGVGDRFEHRQTLPWVPAFGLTSSVLTLDGTQATGRLAARVPHGHDLVFLREDTPGTSKPRNSLPNLLKWNLGSLRLKQTAGAPPPSSTSSSSSSSSSVFEWDVFLSEAGAAAAGAELRFQVESRLTGQRQPFTVRIVPPKATSDAAHVWPVLEMLSLAALVALAVAVTLRLARAPVPSTGMAPTVGAGTISPVSAAAHELPRATGASGAPSATPAHQGVRPANALTRNGRDDISFIRSTRKNLLHDPSASPFKYVSRDHVSRIGK